MNESKPQTWYSRLIREVTWLLGVALTVFLLLALLSFDVKDPGWSYQGAVTEVHNAIGLVGAFVSDWLLSWFGYTAFAVASLPMVIVRWITLGTLDGRIWIARILGVAILIPGLCIMFGLHLGAGWNWLPIGTTGGGILGGVLNQGLVVNFGITGMALSGLVLSLLGLTIVFSVSWPDMLAGLGYVMLETGRAISGILTGRRRPAQLTMESRRSIVGRLLAPINRTILPKTVRNTLTKVVPCPPEADVAQIEAELLGLKANRDICRPEDLMPGANLDKSSFAGGPRLDLSALDGLDNDRREPLISADSLSGSVERNITIAPLNEAQALLDDEPSSAQARPRAQALEAVPGQMALPDLSLLDPADSSSDKGFSQEELTEMGSLLVRRLGEFGVEAEIVAINPGPVVTRFEIDPAPGVKVSRIANLAKDLARSLALVSVRVVEVIPGKSTVGIEIPNQYREMVRLSQILGSDAYTNDPSVLSLALGHDISGQSVCVNLERMPHLLVAGTTGSGKSVGVNAMLLSMLYKARPDDLRLILVDPKMLELSIYEGIPHLLAPVVTDMKDAANALRWCVGEMERRYKLMAALGVRNLEGYNQKIRERKQLGEPIADPSFVPTGFDPNEAAPELKPMPFIVVVIDEFADMMMIVGKKVDQLIARLAQKARAAGIHLILATQRPSVDVITGLIKANVPSRISFQVSSKIDSRTVLDQGGAEQLLGHGDMLYLPAGKPVPVRVHGAFVDDHEVHNVVNFWKMQGPPAYEEAILNAQASGDGDAQGSLLEDEADPLYDEAVAFVTETRRASISAVQRKLKIGYNRAARMIEAMEAAGVVSEMGSNGSREVLAVGSR
ncbi:MAG: DNA translocase FtsK [Oceanospirillales bacterium TMED33]|nr:cell division protein FtsK [Gammaproteobacteria bacterium]RPG20809.1 MAG: DNA translocase FtsK [Oceanospirillales bacterium TMED33]